MGTSCRAVPGGNSPSRIRCRRIEATWSATEVRLISASSMFGLNGCRAGRHVPPKQGRSQVFNNSHIQLVFAFSLTCPLSTPSVSFHSGILPSRRGRGMPSTPIQRRNFLNHLAGPGASSVTSSLRTLPGHPWCYRAGFATPMPERSVRLLFQTQPKHRNDERRS